jgi:hypothetical protein
MTKTMDPLEHRKKLSFEEAEGLKPVPSQLKRGEISQKFRAVLWAELHSELERHRIPASGGSYLNDPWEIILKDAHVHRDNGAVDDFPRHYADIVHELKLKIMGGGWWEVLGFLEFVLKHPSCPDDIAARLDSIMAYCHLGYRVFDHVVICPITTDAERESIEKAFADLTNAKFHGARAHLRKAAEQLMAGHYPDSIRESIHAVEATARTVEPSGALSSALGKLEGKAKIHPAMKRGFVSLYGYTSDEKGIRHPLLDDGDANADETDALFMIGACAAFVSYLINKARRSGA